MNVTFLNFGIAREIIGKKSIQKEFPDSVKTLGELRKLIYTDYPELKELRSLTFAIDERYAQDEDIVPQDSTIALIPPVSGG